MSFSHAQATALNTVSGASTTLTSSLGSAPAAGDLVCVGFVWYDAAGGTAASLTIADGNGNGYTKSPNSPSSINAVDGGAAYLFYLASAPANAHKDIIATYTSPGASGITGLNVDDFTVSGGTAVFDLDAAGNGTGAIVNTPTVARTGSNELMFCYVAPAHVITTANAPWVLGGVITGCGSAYILSVSADTAVNLNVNTAGTWDSMGASFNLAASNTLMWVKG